VEGKILNHDITYFFSQTDFILFFTDNVDSNLNERYCDEWSGARRGVLLYDLKVTGSRIWRCGRDAVLYRHNISSSYVHCGSCGNSSGEYCTKDLENMAVSRLAIRPDLVGMSRLVCNFVPVRTKPGEMKIKKN
jgi:hypothetical protein